MLYSKTFKYKLNKMFLIVLPEHFIKTGLIIKTDFVIFFLSWRRGSVDRIGVGFCAAEDKLQFLSAIYLHH